MDRVGGYEAYVALLEDAHAYEDVVLVMRAEGDAERVRQMESKARGGR